MPRYRARFQDPQGQTQSTFFHASDEAAASAVLQEQSITPTELVVVPELAEYAASARGMSSQSDATGGLIPYKNPPALIAYYLGLFSMVPIFGLFLAIPAMVLGIIGLRKHKQQPAIKGAIHAWFGIIMGAVFLVVWILAIVLGIASINTV